MTAVVLIGALIIILGVVRFNGYLSVKNIIQKTKANSADEISYGKMFGAGLVLIGLAVCLLTEMWKEYIGYFVFISAVIGIILAVYAQIDYGLGICGRLIAKVGESKNIARIKILLVLLIIFNIFMIAFVSIVQEYMGLKYLFLGLNDTWQMYLSFIVIAISISAVTGIRYREEDTDISKGKMVGAIMLSLAIVVCSSFGVIWSAETEYYKIYSPDKKYSVIVEESQWLIAESTDFYARVNPFFVRHIGSLSERDGFNVEEWNENKITVSQGYGESKHIETFELKSNEN